MVSSYTPTLDMLGNAQSFDTKIREPRVAIIVQSEVDGQPTLTHASKEGDRIRETVPAQYVLKTTNTSLSASGSEKTRIHEALDHLREASIVHAACHGIQDPNNPLDSALLLEDGLLTISKIQSVQRAPGGSLAFLSACMSAKGDDTRPDEVIHLAATMLCVGFQSVVATMWYVAKQILRNR